MQLKGVSVKGCDMLSANRRRTFGESELLP